MGYNSEEARINQTKALTRAGLGRPPGSKNKKTIAKERLLNCNDMVKKIADGQIDSPLSILLEIINDDDIELKVRMDAIQLALPYIHKKMPSMVEQKSDITVNNYTDMLSQLSEKAFKDS